MNYQPAHGEPRAPRRTNRPVIIGAGVALVGLVALAAVVTPHDAAPQQVYVGQSTTPHTAPSKASSSTHAVRVYLKANFADATWYGHVRKVEMHGRSPWAITSLNATSATAKTEAHAMCSALSGWAIDKYGVNHFPGVSVRARDGRRLVLRTTLGASC